MKENLSIGQLAKLTDCRVVTIRYYEKVGLLPEPRRSAGGHRVYGPEHLRRLAFVRKGRELGFPLDAVRSLLDLVERKEEPCAAVDAITEAHLAEVRAKIADLKALEGILQGLLRRCGHTTVCECEILGALLPSDTGQERRAKLS